MQFEPRYRRESAWRVASTMWRENGLAAFWRGALPPLWGSTVYRSVMMSSYEATYTALDDIDRTSMSGRILQAEMFGVRPVVVISAVVCSLFRAICESPIDLLQSARLPGQSGRSWQWSQIYRGAGAQVGRTTAMLIFIFVPYDICRRRTTWFRTLFGQWLVTTVICGASYALAWPLETLKNLAQASLPTPGASVAQRIAFLGGWRGLYAGSAPGILCGSFRNGVAMLTMAKYHAFATRIGLRETSKPVERRLDS